MKPDPKAGAGGETKAGVPKKLVSNPSQQQAMDHNYGPMLVIAGAGTGKTTVLIQRIERLIREGLAKPEEILAITYTRNATQLMRQRLRKELPAVDADAVNIYTFHNYCRQVVKHGGRQFRLIEDIDLKIYLRRRIADLKLKHFIDPADLPKFLNDLLDFIRRCQDDLRTPQDYAEHVARMERGEVPIQRTEKGKAADAMTDAEALARCREVADVYATVEEWLDEGNLGMFAHMISGALEVLESNSVALQEEQEQAKFILADEFQDANYAQVKLLRLLAGEPANVFAVGDPDQSIYRFRGASSAAFDMFREMFDEKFQDKKVIRLDENQRSRSPILKCAYAAIDKNPAVFSGEAATLYQRSPLVSAREQRDSLPTPELVEVVPCVTNEAEAGDILEAIREAQQRKPHTLHEHAVLYRTRSHAAGIIEALGLGDIPFEVTGQDILNTPEVRNLLACAEVALDSGEATSLLRVAAMPAFSVEGAELQAALAVASGTAFADVLARVGGGKQVLHAREKAHARVKAGGSAAGLLPQVAS